MAQSLVANLYNPHEQSRTQLIEHFAVRQDVFTELYQALSTSGFTPPVQHYLIEGQRGVGKTTLLLRLSYELEQNSALQARQIPLVFKEEAYYGIRRLFNLWEAIAKELGAKSTAFSDLFEQMEQAYYEDSDYEPLCFEMLSRSLDAQGKKLVLFIDNLGELLRNFNHQEQQRLYEILRTSPLLRIVGGSAIALQGITDLHDDFHALFHIQRLEGLSSEETRTLLLELARNYGQEPTIRTLIRKQPGRIESLRILTGGVIRTMVLLFEVFTDQEDSSTLTDLDLVLDRVTPLYKSRMDDLNPLQREVVNTIALGWDAMTLAEIAHKARLSQEDVAAVLRELEDRFMIEQTTAETPQPFYRLKERFFNIWYLMRMSSGASHDRVVWLVHFLESWYNSAELQQHARKHIRSLTKGQYDLKTAFYLTEALVQTGHLDQDTEHQMLRAARELLKESGDHLTADLSQSDKELFSEGEQAYQAEQYEAALRFFLKIKHKAPHLLFRIGLAFNQLGQYTDAEAYWVKAAEQGHINAMLQLGQLYQYQLQNPQHAEESYLLAVEKGQAEAMFLLGKLYQYNLQEYEKAGKYYLMAVKEGQVRSKVLTSGSFSLKGLKNYLVSAIKGDVEHPDLYEFHDFPGIKKRYLQVLHQTSREAMFQLGALYAESLQHLPKAETYYQMAAEEGHVPAMVALADLYNYRIFDDKKAERFYLLAAEQGDVQSMVNLGLLYHNVFKNPRKAEKYYSMAIERDDLTAMNGLAWLYFEQQREKQTALRYARRIIDAEQNIYTAHTVSCIYLWNNFIDEALHLAEEFMASPEAHENLSQDILLYLMLLLAKQQYDQALGYFETSSYFQEHFRPLFYALLYFMEDENYYRRPPELEEPINDMIKQVQHMAKDYQ